MFSAASQRFCISSDGDDWHSALRSGLQAIMRYGHAQPGYRSMVDPLHSAVHSVTSTTYEKAYWEKVVAVICVYYLKISLMSLAFYIAKFLLSYQE
ncbi:unnamed protein product [Anisakis simplex]|uniref:DhaL domain-containing protein n=1 Tax=Anisakis simplex TaxID=6269 RepID=A0A0M3JIW3_ANISI|nr:unnamed protein product [Anisakis simplex]